MKLVSLTIILCMLSLPLFSQKKQKDTAKVHLPLKEGSVFYEDIIDSIPGASKGELYNASLKWMADSFVDHKNAVKVDNAESGSIIGNGYFEFTTKGFLSHTERMTFMVELTVKDNKSRIRLYKFATKIYGTSGYKSAPSSVDTDFLPIDKQYLQYLNEKEFPKENRNYYQLVKEKIEAIGNSYRKTLVDSANDNF